MMKPRLIAVVLGAALLAPIAADAAPQAAKKKLSISRAERAVRSEIEERYEYASNPRATCDRLTARRVTCSYEFQDPRGQSAREVMWKEPRQGHALLRWPDGRLADEAVQLSRPTLPERLTGGRAEFPRTVPGLGTGLAPVISEDIPSSQQIERAKPGSASPGGVRRPRRQSETLGGRPRRRRVQAEREARRAKEEAEAEARRIEDEARWVETEARWVAYVQACERLAAKAEWDQLLILTDGHSDDESLLWRVAALIGQGHPLAAVTLLDDELRSVDDARRPTLLAVRGGAHEDAGNLAAARRDYARAYAYDRTIPGLGERLARVSRSPSGDRRAAIPRDVKTAVWRRDEGRCVDCGSRENLEFDHVIPVAMGGSNTERNIQLLCEPCNRGKGANL